MLSSEVEIIKEVHWLVFPMQGASGGSGEFDHDNSEGWTRLGGIANITHLLQLPPAARIYHGIAAQA